MKDVYRNMLMICFLAFFQAWHMPMLALEQAFPLSALLSHLLVQSFC